MGPFASNSITKHEYIGRTVQPSNGGVQITPIGGIPAWGVPTWLEGCTTPIGGVDNSLVKDRRTDGPIDILRRHSPRYAHASRSKN